MKYRTSNDGLFRVSADGDVLRLFHGKWSVANKTLCGGINGYYTVHLYADGTDHMQYVHRLVAEAFIPNPQNKPQVNHIDGNKLNNHASNLEWVTAAENIKHAYRTGLSNPYSYGRRCSCCGKRIGNTAKSKICKRCKIIEDSNERRRMKARAASRLEMLHRSFRSDTRHFNNVVDRRELPRNRRYPRNHTATGRADCIA